MDMIRFMWINGMPTETVVSTIQKSISNFVEHLLYMPPRNFDFKNLF